MVWLEDFCWNLVSSYTFVWQYWSVFQVFLTRQLRTEQSNGVPIGEYEGSNWLITVFFSNQKSIELKLYPCWHPVYAMELAIEFDVCCTRWHIYARYLSSYTSSIIQGHCLEAFCTSKAVTVIIHLYHCPSMPCIASDS